MHSICFTITSHNIYVVYHAPLLPTQLQAKRRHKRLNAPPGVTMADIMDQDLSIYGKPTCKICGKGVALALLCCNNHVNKFCVWGESV